jgi:hypothetical protein
MDTKRFDRLARRLSARTPRRDALLVLASLTGLSRGAVAAKDKDRRKKRRRKNQTKVPICHAGKTLVVASSAVPAHLKHGDTLGPCEVLSGSGAAACVPVDQICNPYSPNRCCGSTFSNGIGCYPTAFPWLSVCSAGCHSTAECQEMFGSGDLECVTDFAVCPAAGHCCRPKVCQGNPDCKGGGPCCSTLTGAKRCCSAGQVCATFGGCATP